MGTVLSRCSGRRPPEPQSQLQRRRLRFDNELYSSGPNKPNTIPKVRRLRRSSPADPTRASFLHLPPELRNNIYARVLVIEGYIRVMPEAPTKVPGVAFLRTCKQVHDEAASVLYAANSFYCFFATNLTVSPSMTAAYPDFGALYLQSFNTKSAATGGLFFPAQRYHIWLTRLTIDVKVSLCYVHADAHAEPGRRGWTQHVQTLQYEKCRGIREQIERRVRVVYDEMQQLWAEKERGWEGRLQSERDEWRICSMAWSLSFAEAEREEVAIKSGLRGSRCFH